MQGFQNHTILALFLTALSLISQAKQKPTPPDYNLPVAAQTRISAAIGRVTPAFYAKVSGVGIEANCSGMSARFTKNGFEARNGARVWGMSLLGYGHGQDLILTRPKDPRAEANRVEYQRDGIAEWYINGPFGIEQGFTVGKVFDHSQGQPLTIVLSVRGEVDLSIDKNRTGMAIRGADGVDLFRYRGLEAQDAQGKKLKTWLDAGDGKVFVRVSDAGARFPITVDPIVQLAQLTASDGVGLDEFGYSVAASGGTVVVGAPSHTVGSNRGQGAVYVFVKPNGGWGNMTQVAELTASDGVSGDGLGLSVAIAGATIVAGAPGSSSSEGASYLFVEPVGGWQNMTESAKLTASDHPIDGQLGHSVSMTYNTVVATGNGSVYMFVEPEGGWQNMNESAQLKASDGAALSAVAIGGETVVAGAPAEGQGRGEVYVFTKRTTGWLSLKQTARLTASDGKKNDALGSSVAISSNTVVAGAPGKNRRQGAAYIFVSPSGGWVDMTETAQLSDSGGSRDASFAYSVDISSNGKSIFSGAPSQISASGEGLVYLFLQAADGWHTTSVPNMTFGVQNGAHFGFSLGSSSGSLVVGADTQVVGSQAQGAAYVFGVK
jgi:uncharacterized protein (DUF2345 family)